MNLGKGFLIPQENGVTHNGEHWIPVTPEKPIMQKSDPIAAEMRGNHMESMKWRGSLNDMFPPEKLNMRRSHPITDEVQVNHTTSMKSGELLTSAAEMEGNQINSRNWLEFIQFCNGILLEKPVAQSLNPTYAEMQGNQARSTNWQKSLGIDNRLSAENSTTQSSVTTEMPGNQTESTDWQELLGVYRGYLQENPKSYTVQNFKSARLLGHGKHDIQGGAVEAKGLSSPGNSITQSSVTNEMPGNQTESSDWQEWLGVYRGYLQENSKSYTVQNFKSARLLGHGEHDIQGGAVEAKGCSNQNADSYQQTSSKDILVRNDYHLVELQGIKNAAYAHSVNQKQNRSVSPISKLCITSSHSQVGNNWREKQSACSMFLQQDQTLSPNQGISICSLQKTPNEGFPLSYRTSYNLNSPPRGEPAAAFATNFFQIAPDTPDQGKRLKNQQVSEMENIYMKESQSQRKDMQDTLSADREDVGNHSDHLLQSVITSHSASNSTSLEEKKISGDEVSESIDLNKTPQQKPPKRKKHRPKVVVEGKPKRTPKRTPPSKTNISNENGSGKRRYVRKKSLEASTSQQENGTNVFEASTVRSAAKSCRRALKFNLEEETQEKRQDMNSNNRAKTYHASFDLNLNSLDTPLPTGLPRASVIAAAEEGQQNAQSAEKHLGENTCNPIHATNQKLVEKLLSLAPATPPATARDHTLNVIARSLNPQNGTPYQPNDRYGYGQVQQQMHGEAVGQLISQPNTAWAKLGRARKLMLQSRTELIKDVAEVNKKRGSKRDHCHISQINHSLTSNSAHCQFSGEPEIDSTKLGTGYLETSKKKKFEDACHGAGSSMTSCTAAVKDNSRHVKSRGKDGVHATNSLYTSGRLPNCIPELDKTFRIQDNGGNGILEVQNTNLTAVRNSSWEQRSLLEVDLHRDWMARKIIEQNIESRIPKLPTGITDPNLLYPLQSVPKTAQGNETRTSQADRAEKRQMVLLEPSNPAFSKGEGLPKEKKKETGHLFSSRKARGLKEEQKHVTTIDEIIYRLKGLEISNSRQLGGAEQTALIPYKEDGAIVPFEGFDPIRRRKPRPKVDLDPETNRLWNLLMGKAGSESTETMDKEKEIWWEEEREVFRGRVDSFIARMHLVQGDRRFSRWKGSVVDSVIGVFLTQNVSDHLSSSAFMSLAAAFPFRLSNIKRTCQNTGSTWLEEPDPQIIDPDGTITYHGRILRQPLYKQNSMTSRDSSEQRSENLITEIGLLVPTNNNRGTEEEVVSSQNSSDSLSLQAGEDVRSGSDSEVEDQIILCNTNKNNIPNNIPQTEIYVASQQHQTHAISSPYLDKMPIPGYQQLDNPACMRQYPGLEIPNNVCAYPINSSAMCFQGPFDPSSGFWWNKTSDFRIQEHWCSGSSAKQHLSFLPSGVEVNKNGGVAHARKNKKHMVGSSSSSTSYETGMPSHGQSSYSNHQGNLQLRSYSGSSQQCVNSNQEKSSKSFLQESVPVTNARQPDEAYAESQNGIIHSSGEKFSSTSTDMANARNRKIDVGKTREFEWDTLRKQALSGGGKKERGKDQMDSLDYEALRHADVKRISDAIKERGMNNMLAERMKDFLNRLVRDHGSTDLEWLRDVPPDKAKDYLLSVRGLGLKSVECVRLLTLHHMAFPVDTNVGRIAVRLGWVPLQPLPESLQLHLLELYPVLESIQKYLWPRLCKLDQRTLYELHYQMITFGKVFCTKSRPNCNACPMRGECRHFASAFASARLALPGPEERSIVNSTTPIAVKENPAVTVKPLPLLPAETVGVRGPQYISSICEPIIEEPTTPEPSTEVSESDIEDLLSEDPDEIPTIKLSLEKLRMNLQSIIQEQNIAIPEGDLSRALVAIDPAAASIPAPKLKNVSRLRTEHQVYELPDSHPLLKGMDRREPDDPSPYLLAIWTPGETASSIQPPESKCSFQGSGKLCNEKTCFSCSSIREANSQTVRGTLLIPCRTAMRGSFPLNGTYFQVNEVFADNESSVNPIDVSRDWIWQLRRRTVYFGTSVSTIFRGLSTEGIQYCFWRGFVCVRGFDQKTRAPRPLMARLHYPASKMAKSKNEKK